MIVNKKIYATGLIFVLLMCSVNVAQGKDWIKFFTGKNFTLTKSDSIEVSVKDAIVKNSALIRYDVTNASVGKGPVFYISVNYLNQLKAELISIEKDTIRLNTANINPVVSNEPKKTEGYMLNSDVYMSWIILGVLSCFLLVFGITQYYLRKKVPTSEKEQYPKYEDPKWVLNNLLRDNLGLLAYIKTEYKLENINREEVIGTLTEKELINILESQPQWLSFIMQKYKLQSIPVAPDPTPIITYKEPVILTTKYAGHPAHKSNKFVQPSDKAIAGMTIYELSIDEKNGKGTFKMTDHAVSQQLAIREYDTRILPACDFDDLPTGKTRIETLQLGEIKKVQDGWEITRKTKIRFT